MTELQNEAEDGRPLMLVAERDGPAMFARLAVMQALNRHSSVRSTRSCKDHHWGIESWRENYAPNAAKTGGVLTVSDGTHTANLTLVGKYSSFDQANDGSGGIDITIGAMNRWKTGVDGDWATSANWTSGVTPAAGEFAEINALGTYTVTSSSDETVGSLGASAGATLDVTGGLFTVTSGTGLGSNLGTISVEDGAAIKIKSTAFRIGDKTINDKTTFRIRFVMGLR